MRTAILTWVNAVKQELLLFVCCLIQGKFSLSSRMKACFLLASIPEHHKIWSPEDIYRLSIIQFSIRTRAKFSK